MIITPKIITVNFGQNILNTHDNIFDSEDVAIILIEAYISTDDLDLLSNQVNMIACVTTNMSIVLGLYM